MRLLVVEDDIALSMVLVRGLAEEGHAVDSCTTMRDAEHQLTEERYDLVVLDLGLPDGDGMSLCRWLRDRGDSVPVLMLTARDELRDDVDEFETFFRDF